MPPSLYSALTEPIAIPTIERAFHAAPALRRPAASDSPWVLVEATTRSASDGWVSEEVRAWSADRMLLGVAQQLRLIVG